MSDINIKINVVSQAAQASVSGLARDAKKAEQGFKDLNVNIKQGSSLLASFGGNLLATAATKAVGVLARQFTDLVGAAFEAASALESIRTKFEVLTGSAAKANSLIQDLQNFAANTPFQFEDVAQAGQTLLAFGFSTVEVKDNLQDLGDVAAATGVPLKDVSLIFGQVAAAGKLTGERLNQLAERGVNIGPALAEALGQPETAIRDLVARGKVDFATFEKAFKSLNDEGNIAFGGMAKRAETLEGRISTLKDNFQIFSAAIGERITPAVKAVVSAFTELLQTAQNSGQFQSFLNDLQKAVPTVMGVIAASITTVIEVSSLLIQVVRTIGGAFAGLATVALSNIERLAKGINALLTLVDEDLNFDNLVQDITDLKEGTLDFAANTIEANNATAESARRLTDAISTGTDIVLNKYSEEVVAANAAKQAVTTAAQEKADKEEAEEKRRTQVLRSELQQRLQYLQEQAIKEEELALLKLEKEAFLDGEKTATEELKILQEGDRLARVREQEQLNLLDRLGDKEAFAKASLEVETNQAKRSIEIDKATAKIKKEQRDRELKDQQTFFSTATTLANSENKTLLAIGRAAALAQLAIKTPEAVASSFAFGARIGGPPLGFVFGGIAAAAMAAQAAQIAGAKFEQGGIVGGNSFSGDNVVARVNSGEMILNRQQQSNLFALANGAGGSGQMIEVTSVVQIGEEEIARAVSRQVAQGFALGEGGV